MTFLHAQQIRIIWMNRKIYEYLICAICPVDLSKPGLGLESEQRIGPRIRDWVVGQPEQPSYSPHLMTAARIFTRHFSIPRIQRTSF